MKYLAKDISLREARESKGLSLRKAAELLGVTHAYLSGLELGHKPLKEDRAKEITKLYGISPKIKLVQPLPTDSSDFVQWISEQLKWWDSRFVLPMIPAVTSTITDLFVEPSFLMSTDEYISSSALLKTFFQDKKNPGLLLSGSLGSGKSFFLRLLVLQTKKLLSDAKVDKQYIPFFVSLGDFDLRTGSLVQSLVEYYMKLGYAGSSVQLERFITQCIDRGNALFLFDGLDEIRIPEESSKFLARIEQVFVSNLRSVGNKLIISGQPSAFQDRSKKSDILLLAKIERWHPSQMYEACKRWSWDESQQAEQFWLLIQGNSALYNLARWPLLFHLLTTLHSAYGLKPFQELVKLYDSCCEVLENSWSSARRALALHNTQSPVSNPFEEAAWLKWRHFLIHLMSYAYQRSLDLNAPIDFTFTATEVGDLWESFLAERGIQKQTTEFARLQDLIHLDRRIGPMLCNRVKDESGNEREVYTFLEQSFGDFYLAKALINNPDDLESIVLKHLRDFRWQKIIPLIIQDLGRSERLPERKLGEKLLELILNCDDEFQLEHKYNIGSFGLFTAMRSIGSYNIERFRGSIVEPFLKGVFGERKLALFEERLGANAWRIMGEYNAVPQIRKLCSDRFDELFNSKDPPNVSEDYRWNILTAMALMGENFEFVTKEVENDIRSITNLKKSNFTINKRVGLRRQFWRLRQVGRLFASDDSPSHSGIAPSPVKRLRVTLEEVLDTLLNEQEKEFKTKEFRNYQYWHAFSVILKSYRKLHYYEDLKILLNKSLRLILKHFDTAFGEYPHLTALFQFVKVAARYAYLIDEKLINDLERKFRNTLSELSQDERLDVQTVITLFEIRRSLNYTNFDKNPLYEKVYGKCDKERISDWVSVVKNQTKGIYDNVIALGAALTCLGQFCDRIIDDDSPIGRKAVIAVLLKAYEIEKSIPDQQLREESRCYTRPFSDYGFPLYDHFYITLTALAAELPVKKQDSRSSN